MERLTHRALPLAILAIAAAYPLAPPASAGDVSVQLDADSAFTIEDSTGSVERLRVDEATGDVSRDGTRFLHSTGTSSLFLGAEAGNAVAPEASGNTGVGFRALYSDTTGTSNVAFGDLALGANTTGSRNVAIGQNAGQNQTTGSDNVYLANPGVAAESGRIRIGADPTHTAAFIAGISGKNVGASALPVFVSSSGQLGTDGPSQQPWTGPMDGGGYPLVDSGPITTHPVTDGSGGWLLSIPNTTGYGFGLASSETPLHTASGATRDTIGTLGFNMNASGSGVGSVFNPGFFLSFEQNFDAGGWPIDTFSEFHWIPQSVSGTANIASEAGLAVDDLVVVEEPSDGSVVGYGFIDAVAASTVTVNWIYSRDAANPPANGDTLEKTSATTVTDRTGTFAMNGGGVFVASSGSCTGLDATTASAVLALTSVANQTGTVADLAWIRTQGTGAALAPGNCVKQFATGATALLGSVTVSQSTAVTSSWAPSTSSWRPFTSSFRTHAQRAAMVFFSSKEVYDAGIPTLAIGGNGEDDGHWLGIATQWSSGSGMDIVGAIGDPGNQQNFGLHGKFWFFEPGQYSPSQRIELGAPADVTGIRTQALADASGTIAVLDLTGCADDAPVLASGSTGGLKCGAPEAPALQAAPATVMVPYRIDLSRPGGEEPADELPDLAVDYASDPASMLVDDELAPRLLKEMKRQRRLIRAQGQEIAALTARLERLEARTAGAEGETEP